jgi:A/G-specific adenine glycosylase
MQKAALQILEKHAGKFPETFDDVLALPGIGRYTAGAICSISFNQPVPILEGNVIRVLTRIYGIAENPREKKTNAILWQSAENLVTEAARITIRTSRFALRASHLNQSLMELGALICTPRAPQCQICPVRKICVVRRENRAEELPNIGKRPKQTTRRFAAFVVERDETFLVRQRPAGVVNAHLWEFPNMELNGETHLPTVAKSALGFIPKKLYALCEIKHSITRYRITLEAHCAEAPITRSARIGIRSTKGLKGNSTPRNRWLSIPELKKLSFPSAHKKILVALAEGL